MKRNYKPNSSQIINFCKSGLLFQAIKHLNITNSTEISLNVKPLVYASLLQTATKLKSFNHGFQLHSHVLKSSLLANSLVGNSLLSFYFKLGGSGLFHASKLFDELTHKDVISWTSMMSGYVRVNPRKALDYFRDMLNNDIEVNAFTLSAGVKACSQIGDVKLGKCFHGVVFKGGFEFNYVIASALIDMYGKCEQLMYVRHLFDQLPEPDAVCWSSVISCLTKNELYEEGLTYFYLMQRKHKLVPDEFTYGSILTACGNLGRLKQGKQVHARVIMTDLGGDIVVGSSLVDMYGKCGRVKDSQSVFDRMRKKNAVSWCALLNGYCQNGHYESVFRIFRTMDNPDLYSFGTIIRACTALTAVRHGKEVHCQYVRKGGQGHVVVESALIDLYAKCGFVDYAERLFIQMPIRNSISWNSMICGFAQNGRGIEAIGLFEQMIKEGFSPDYINCIGVIFACSHTGLFDEGRRYFASMTEQYGIRPGTEHYNCMVDLLGRAGLIKEAEELIEKAVCKDSSSLWATLLGACTTSRNYVAVERIARKMMEFEPSNHFSYIHLINVYKSVGRWNDAMNVRKLMEVRGVTKLHGKSWVEDTNIAFETNLPSANVL
ncbi:pentatricopeptide repeat-containing protein At1g03540 [Silene latifolia]|uniref:pentatricopeptide repeat-containing protein At1g03540 n=1 Tax=Silene latifolia TaxID=37657 RepID=UPI003D789E9F